MTDVLLWNVQMLVVISCPLIVQIGQVSIEFELQEKIIGETGPCATLKCHISFLCSASY